MQENGGITLPELRETKRDQILRLAAGYGARNVRVFGSIARGDNSSASDIDVATEGMLRPKVRERALLDAVLL